MANPAKQMKNIGFFFRSNISTSEVESSLTPPAFPCTWLIFANWLTLLIWLYKLKSLLPPINRIFNNNFYETISRLNFKINSEKIYLFLGMGKKLTKFFKKNHFFQNFNPKNAHPFQKILFEIHLSLQYLKIILTIEIKFIDKITFSVRNFSIKI